MPLYQKPNGMQLNINEESVPYARSIGWVPVQAVSDEEAAAAKEAKKAAAKAKRDAAAARKAEKAAAKKS